MNDDQRQKADIYLQSCVFMVKFPDGATAKKVLKSIDGKSFSTKGTRNSVLSIMIGSYANVNILTKAKITFTPLPPFVCDGINTLSKYARLIAEGADEKELES